jgi:hypothetical protein
MRQLWSRFFPYGYCECGPADSTRHSRTYIILAPIVAPKLKELSSELNVLGSDMKKWFGGPVRQQTAATRPTSSTWRCTAPTSPWRVATFPPTSPWHVTTLPPDLRNRRPSAVTVLPFRRREPRRQQLHPGERRGSNDRTHRPVHTRDHRRGDQSGPDRRPEPPRAFIQPPRPSDLS